ncbi:hypothetical protein MLD38_019110 [Melastoma candidum]|uniref:Uncharacterized protein n=1 Tax=Melastoma candidum TaxID=119954 RepID=A0ACB9QVV5_9MYRT|nr:hypothetical protein MLD38_019110 [Melastoma candidum]
MKISLTVPFPAPRAEPPCRRRTRHRRIYSHSNFLPTRTPPTSPLPPGSSASSSSASPPSTIETGLSSAAVFPTPPLIEEVLRYSHNYPTSGVMFYQWAGVGSKHTVGCWNLIVRLAREESVVREDVGDAAVYEAGGGIDDDRFSVCFR